MDRPEPTPQPSRKGDLAVAQQPVSQPAPPRVTRPIHADGPRPRPPVVTR